MRALYWCWVTLLFNSWVFFCHSKQNLFQPFKQHQTSCNPQLEGTTPSTQPSSPLRGEPRLACEGPRVAAGCPDQAYRPLPTYLLPRQQRGPRCRAGCGPAIGSELCWFGVAPDLVCPLLLAVLLHLGWIWDNLIFTSETV